VDAHANLDKYNKAAQVSGVGGQEVHAHGVTWRSAAGRGQCREGGGDYCRVVRACVRLRLLQESD
jgi:hypothetical protein